MAVALEEEPASLERGWAQRSWSAGTMGAGAGMVVVTGIAGIAGSTPVALAAASVAAVLGGILAWKRPFVGRGSSRGIRVLAAVATIAAVIQCGRLAVFMIDSARRGFSSVPVSTWEVRHSCLTAYFVAGQAAGAGQDPYADALYSEPGKDAEGKRIPRTLGPFPVDVYEYPPPFLLLPRLCTLLTSDFTHLRMLWFALDLAILFVAIPLVARSMGLGVANRALLLAPLVLVALPTLSGLQKGNIQLEVFALSLLAMLLFERRHFALGGALLAFTTVSKLFPGLLVLYLIGRRRWRAVAWTVGAGAVYVGLALLDLGWTPFRGFLAHLPGLLGGEAFPAFQNPKATAINYSIPGLVFKLRLFGVPGMGFVAARILGALSTLAVIVVVLRAARSNRSDSPLVWLAILILASLCSPFLPQGYAGFAPVWMLTLLAASWRPSPKALTGVVLIWLGLDLVWPIDWPMDLRALALLTLLPQALTLALAVYGLRMTAAETRD